MRILSPIRFKFLGLCACLTSLWGCVEPYGGTDNQIVVIGNGSNWSNTLVVDIAKTDHYESLVWGSDGLNPVAKKLESERPKEVNPVASSANSASAVETSSKIPVQPLFLEWIVPNHRQSFILKADHLNQNAQVKEQQVYEAGAKGTTRRQDLEDLPFSTEIRPLFLSDGSVIFVDPNHQLYIRNADRKTLWLGSDMSDLMSDGRQGIFYKTQGIWFTIGIPDILSETSLHAARSIFARGILYRADGDTIYVLSLETNSENNYRLQNQILYEWSGQTKSFSPLWKTPAQKFAEIDVSQNSSGPNSYFSRAQIQSSLSKDIYSNLVSIDRKGVEVIPCSTSKTEARLVAGQNILAILSESNHRLNSIELCQRDKSNHWTCEWVKDAPAGISDLVINDKDEIFALGSDRLFQVHWTTRVEFKAIEGTERSDLVGLRFLQVPLGETPNSKTRNLNPPSL